MQAGAGAAVPAFWSAGDREPLAGLPPSDWSRHQQWYEFHGKSCPEILDADGLRASALSVVLKNACGDERCITPVWSLTNHHNGLRNYVMSLHGDDAVARTLRPVAAGEELFISYGTGTPEIFRDYGFLEPKPQTWWFESLGQKWNFSVLDDGVRIPADQDYGIFARAADVWLKNVKAVGEASTPWQRTALA